MYVYIAGPYTKGDWGGNVRRAVDAAETVYQNGHTPFIPHTMTGLWSLIDQKDKGEWLEFDLNWLDKCDAMIKLGGESEGADIEEKYAKNNGIYVFYGVDRFLQSEVVVDEQ